MRRKRFAKKRLLAWLLTMVMVVTLVPSVVSEAAGDYVKCPAGTVTWKMIKDKPGTYFWWFHGQNDENYKYGYYTLTAVKIDEKMCVRIENIDKGDTRYLKLKKDDDSGSKYDWGEDSPHRGSSIYRAEASGGEKAETFQITFNMNGHGSPISPQSVESGKTATKPANPTAEGYTFVGWYTNSNGTQAYDFNSAVTDDLTLYAVWNYAGGSGGSSWTTTVKGSGTVNFSKDKYNFSVDITITDGKITNITSALTSTPKESKSKTKYHPNAVTAILKQLKGQDATTTAVDAISSGTPKYSYAALKTAISTAIKNADLSSATGNSRTVTFDMNGHGTSIVQELSSGETATKPVDPTENGYTFGGWYTTAACTTAWNFSTPVTANTTLYAKWTGDSDAVQITNPATVTNNNLELSKELSWDEESNTYTVTLTGRGLPSTSEVPSGYYATDPWGTQYTYNTLTATQYYYLFTDGNLYPITASTGGSSADKPYIAYFTVKGTKYYLKKPYTTTLSDVGEKEDTKKIYESKEDKGYPRLYKKTTAYSTAGEVASSAGSKSVTYSLIKNGTYYYLYNGSYYLLETYSKKNKYGVTFTANGTTYYLSSSEPKTSTSTVTSETATICTTVLYNEPTTVIYTSGSSSNDTAYVLKDTINTANFDTSWATAKVTSGSASAPSFNKTSGLVTVTGYNYSGNANGTPLTVTISGLKAKKTGNAVASNSGNAGIYASSSTTSALVSISSPTARIPEKYEYTVTFKAVNGTFHDGMASKTVTLTGKTSPLYLDASDIPVAGKKPNAGYKTGAWDNVPTNSTPITGNTTFTYTYQTDSVLAVSDGKYIDATSTVVVEDTGDHYVPRVTVVVENGIIKGLEVTAPEAGTDNQDFLNEAVEGIRDQIVGRRANSTTAESIDVISGATCASRTLKLEIGAALDAKNLIRWLNYDNRNLDEAYISTGTMPEYTAELPVKLGETFIGWNPVMSTVNGSADYVAQFSDSGNLEKTYELEVQPVSYDTGKDTATGVYQYLNLSEFDDAVYLLPGFTLKTFVGDQLVSTETIGARYSEIYNIECVPIDTDNEIFETWSINKEWLKLKGKTGQAEAIMKVSKKDGSVPEVVSLPFLVKVLPLPDADTVLADGVYGDYSLTVPRYGYKVILAITVEGGKITEVEGDADSEATADNREYINMALTGLRERLVGQVAKISSADGLDAVSGATTVSNAYILEAQKALSEPSKGPYTVSWTDESSAVLGQNTSVKYGMRTAGIVPKVPEKPGDESNTYEFKQWLDTFDLFVTVDKSYRAEFDTATKYSLTTEDVTWDVSKKLDEQDTNAEEFWLCDEKWDPVDYFKDASHILVKPKITYTVPATAAWFNTDNYKVIMDVEDETIAGDGEGDYYIYPTGKTGATRVTMKVWSKGDDPTLLMSSTFTFTVTSSITPIDDGKYIDGTTQTAQNNASINYSPVVTVLIQNGKIISLSADPTESASGRNKTLLNRALQWINSELANSDATVQSIENLEIKKEGNVVDAVSGATLSAQCLKTAALKAVAAESVIQWVDEDETTTLDQAKVTTGTLPPFQGITPTKEGDEQYSYTFSGWSPSVEPVTGDKTYKATYLETTNEYKITWVNEDGTVLETDENVAYGTTPSYDGETPTKEATAQYTYAFAGWTPEVTSVAGDVTYTATYNEVVRNYTVTWNNYDGTLLKSESVAYGEIPSYEDEIPEKVDPENEFTYQFTGWYQADDPTETVVDLTSVTVTGDLTYKAKFEQQKTGWKIILTDYTKGGVTTDLLEEKYYSGKVLITVAAPYATVFGLYQGTSETPGSDEHGAYERLYCSKNEDDTYTFELEMPGTKDIYLAAGYKGDFNLDGIVNLKDSTLIGRSYTNMDAVDGLQLLFGDIYPDGKVNLKDATFASQIFVKSRTGEWDLKEQ